MTKRDRHIADCGKSQGTCQLIIRKYPEARFLREIGPLKERISLQSAFNLDRLFEFPGQPFGFPAVLVFILMPENCYP